MYSTSGSITETEPQMSEADHLRRLQEEHKEIEDAVRERLQSLKMQARISELPFDLVKGRRNKQMIAGIEQQQQEAQFHFSQQLLRRQVEIQEEAEMRELVKNYQERIGDLRGSLVNKEAEIVYETYDKKRSEMAKRQNMRNLNLQYQQLHIFKRELKEIQKLRFEVEAIEHTLRQYELQSKPQNKEFGLKTEMTFERSDRTGFVSQTFSRSEKRVKASGDPLVVRVFALLENEIRKEDEVRAQLGKLNAEMEEVCSQNKHLIEKYKKVAEERRKAVELALQPVDNSNILEELEEESLQEASKVEQLFQKKDQNKQDIYQKDRNKSRESKFNGAKQKENEWQKSS